MPTIRFKDEGLDVPDNKGLSVKVHEGCLFMKHECIVNARVGFGVDDRLGIAGDIVSEGVREVLSRASCARAMCTFGGGIMFLGNDGGFAFRGLNVGNNNDAPKLRI